MNKITMSSELKIQPGLRKGTVSVPLSKSHLHRLMIAEFLANYPKGVAECPSEITSDTLMAEDVLATRSCLEALQNEPIPTLNCRESGSTLRFLLPVAMACRNEAFFTAEGRLPQRPIKPFLDLLSSHGVKCLSDSDNLFPLHMQGNLQPGEYLFPGNISSQIVTGLLMALPLLKGDSTIRLTSPMESSGYVEMTLQVLRDFQITIISKGDSYHIPGNQRYHTPANLSPEVDWSGVAFWLAMNHMGSQIALPPLPEASRQPDKMILPLLTRLGSSIDVSQSPDIFPVLAVAAAATHATTIFTGVKRLRLKESDRLAAMANMLERFGITTVNEENHFTVQGIGPHFKGDVTIDSCNDHRIAISAAVAATVATGTVTISNPSCVRKSYPDFFQQFQKLSFLTDDSRKVRPHPYGEKLRFEN